MGSIFTILLAWNDTCDIFPKKQHQLCDILIGAEKQQYSDSGIMNLNVKNTQLVIHSMVILEC